MTKAEVRIVGALLRMARESSGETIGDLARHLGISVSEVSDAERGRVPLTIDQLESAVAFLRGPGILINPDE